MESRLIGTVGRERGEGSMMERACGECMDKLVDEPWHPECEEMEKRFVYWDVIMQTGMCRMPKRTVNISRYLIDIPTT